MKHPKVDEEWIWNLSYVDKNKKNLMYAHPLYFLQKNKHDISVNSIESVNKYCKTLLFVNLY